MDDRARIRASESELRAEFPAWWIRRGESGWWIAVRKRHAILRAPGPDELRELLHEYGADRATDHTTGADSARNGCVSG